MIPHGRSTRQANDVKDERQPWVSRKNNTISPAPNNILTYRRPYRSRRVQAMEPLTAWSSNNAAICWHYPYRGRGGVCDVYSLNIYEDYFYRTVDKYRATRVHFQRPVITGLKWHKTAFMGTSVGSARSSECMFWIFIMHDVLNHDCIIAGGGALPHCTSGVGEPEYFLAAGRLASSQFPIDRGR